MRSRATYAFFFNFLLSSDALWRLFVAVAPSVVRPCRVMFVTSRFRRGESFEAFPVVASSRQLLSWSIG